MQLPDVKDVVGQVLEAHRARRHVWVTGTKGSGRTMLASRLLDTLSDSVFLELPALREPDASSAALLLAWNAAGGGNERLVEDDGRLSQIFTGQMAASERPLLIRLRGRLPENKETGNDRTELLRTRIRDVLSAAQKGRSVIYIADRGLAPNDLGLDDVVVVDLPPHASTLDPREFAEYEPQAWELQRRLGSSRELLPVVWRLAVGALALGASLDRVVGACMRTTAEALSVLAGEVGLQVQSREDLSRSVKMLVLMRSPLPLSRTFAIAGTPREYRSLLAQCIGYGEPLHLNQVVRERLRESVWSGVDTDPGERERIHFELARGYEHDDGALDPRGLPMARTMAWIEKLHSLASAGGLGASLWAEQVKPCPELYWDRGRELSRGQRDYVAAAEVYRSCIDVFPGDHYSHHYLAWNLDRAEVPRSQWRADIAGHYEEAVRLDPRNPWWNARWISYLIRSRRWVDAIREWRAALERIDQDGMSASTDPWLFAHLHYWVAREWVAAGVWYEARAIMDAVPPHVIQEVQEGAAPGSWRNVQELEQTVREQVKREHLAFDTWCDANQGEDGRWMAAVALVQDVLRRFPGIPLPALSEGEDGVLLTWSHPALILEIEVADEIDWTARDRIEASADSGSSARGVIDGKLHFWLTRIRHG